MLAEIVSKARGAHPPLVFCAASSFSTIFFRARLSCKMHRRVTDKSLALRLGPIAANEGLTRRNSGWEADRKTVDTAVDVAWCATHGTRNTLDVA